MAYVGVVDPHIFLHIPSVLVQKLDAQMGVLFGIIDEIQIAVIPQHPQGFAGQIDVPLDIFIPRSGECAPVIAYANVVVRIAIDHINAGVRQIPQDRHHVIVDYLVPVFIGQRIHRGTSVYSAFRSNWMDPGLSVSGKE